MTTLVKQSLLPEFEAMERRFRRMVDGMTPFIPPVLPAADVYETPKEYVIELEVPGYAEAELGIEVSDHTLTVTGKREENKKEAEKTYRLQERLERTFKREFLLPPETDSEHVTAHFEHGVLQVHAAKAATTTPKKVEITK
jgi:HSP20 family protein